MICKERIGHGRHCHNGEKDGGCPPDAVTEIQETDGETA